MVHQVLGVGNEVLEAVFVSRPNQFTLVLSLNGQEIRAAMADRGRLRWLFVPGCRVLIEPRDGQHRKTPYQVLGAYDVRGRLVSLDTTLPNRLIREALAQRALSELGDYEGFATEQTIGQSRFDFVLNLQDDARFVLEVKSVGRVDEDDVARFPDAPTARGRKHVEALMALLHQSPKTQVGIMFVVQSEYATHVEVDDVTDPDFLDVLSAAVDAGVCVMARACSLTEEGITLGDRLPVILDA